MHERSSHHLEVVRIDLGVILLISFFMAFSEKFTWGNADYLVRFLIWTIQLGVGVAMAVAVDWWLREKAMPSANRLVQLLVVCVVTSVPLAVYAHALVFKSQFIIKLYLFDKVYSSVLLMVIAITAIFWLVRKTHSQSEGVEIETHPPASNDTLVPAHARDEAVIEDKESSSGEAKERKQEDAVAPTTSYQNVDVSLEDRVALSVSVLSFASALDAEYQDAILLAMFAEDHRVCFITSMGEVRAAVKFTDALSAVELVNGQRVHRSWWVAKAAIASVEKMPNKAEITLITGHTVPVSRTYLKQLVEADWVL